MISLGFLMGLSGCFKEQAFPIQRDDYRRIAPLPDADPNPQGRTTREWLTHTHAQLAPLLSERGQLVMLTEDLVDGFGQPRDVYAYMQTRPENLNKLLRNFYGILHTAQGTNQSELIDDDKADLWPGFEDVWIPVADDVALSGRLGFARENGKIPYADCIILLPGLWGDNRGWRTRDLATALREHGFHVLAVELRGHGQTERWFPEIYYNFGAIETQDLVRTANWLEDQHPQVRNTGLIGFCWGANLALLAAWYDARTPDDPSITPTLAAYLDPPSERIHFQAGVMAMTPLLDWECLLDRADVEHDLLDEPAMYFFQRVVESRMIAKDHPERSGNLRNLIAFEFDRSFFGPGFPKEDGYRFIRLMPYKGRHHGDKLEKVRIPVLMAQSVNDPFTSSQEIADLMAITDNPNVAAMVLRGGGHVGYFPYNRAYTYSLILNFFDPERGAAAAMGRR
jgi:predicted alpha/beta-fold hydrolase